MESPPANGLAHRRSSSQPHNHAVSPTRSLSPDPSPAPKQVFHKDHVPLHMGSLMSGLTGAAHYSSANTEELDPSTKARASFGDALAHGEAHLEGRRKQLADDLQTLYDLNTPVEITELLQRWFKPDAIFEDPLCHCVGFKEYASQFILLHKLATSSKGLSFKLLSSTHNPNRMVILQKREYVLKVLGKKVIESMVLLDLDEEEHIVKLEERWNSKDLPVKHGAFTLRRTFSKVTPILISIPKPNDRKRK